ncbi:MAG: sulfatase-like hydrolase/transferase [Eubacterium ramulus]
MDTYKQNNDVTQYETLLKERYPDRDMLLRRFVSDSYDYSKWWKTCLKTGTNPNRSFSLMSPCRITADTPCPTQTLHRKFMSQISTVYPKANRYLSLVKRSDDAFRELTEYFSQVTEPTIICMFGDHLPSIEDEFYEELFGTRSGQTDH